MTTRMKWALAVLVVAIIGGAVAYRLLPREAAPVAAVTPDNSRRVLYWYDPMVPAQHFDAPGKSPFMDMQLQPKYADTVAGDDVGINVSATMQQNLGIRYGHAERRVFSDTLSAVARVEVDEHRVQTVQMRTAGFVEKLYIRAVGDTVHAGQKIAEVYAPGVLAAAQEWLALTRVDNVPDVEALRAGARQRLQLLGMTTAEIQRIEATGVVPRTLGVYAPANGIVQELGVREGAQALPGTTLLRIVDVSRVWLIAEVPERDLGRITLGQRADITLPALPRARLSGRVDYVYPDLDMPAGTGRVRIALENHNGLLRPGLSATATLISAARTLLMVPSEAIIDTGKRRVVIQRDHGVLRPAEVRTGVEQQGHTEILAGLADHAEVVVSGQFLIGSEATLNGLIARLAPTLTPDYSGHAVVRKIDAAHGLITLDHGPIAALQWPAMTMTFRLRDATALHGLIPGASVDFELQPQPENGAYVIAHIAREAGK